MIPLSRNVPDQRSADGSELAIAVPRMETGEPVIMLALPEIALWGQNKSCSKSYAKVERRMNLRREPA